MLSNIANIDERYDKMSDLYEILFQSLLGRSDIGITATNNDSQIVREYIDTTATFSRLYGVSLLIRRRLSSVSVAIRLLMR